MSNIDAIAKKEFADAIRSRSLIVGAATFFLLMLLLTGLYLGIDFIADAFAQDGDPAVEGMINLVTTGATTLVPVLAIVLSYKAIVSERTSGSLSVMLSLPNTRADVFFGKFVGRSMILLFIIAAGFASGFAVSLWSFGLSGALTFFQYALFISVLGIVYVALGLALSGATKSGTLATVGSLGLFALFRFLWTPVLLLAFTAISRVRTGSWEPNEEVVPELLVELMVMLNPHNAYGVIVDQVVYGQATGGIRQGVIESGSALGSPAVGSVVLLCWIVVPLALGYLRFSSVDL